jgi:predicted nucleic acid-binding protein
MRLAMDTDAIVKLTKAGAKEVVAAEHILLLSPEVAREAIDQGKLGGHADAVLIEENVRIGRVSPKAGRNVARGEAIIRALRLSGGEAGALRLYLTARADAVVTDDRTFVRAIRSVQVPTVSSSGVLLDLVERKQLGPEEGLRLLAALRPMISPESYFAARAAMEAA